MTGSPNFGIAIDSTGKSELQLIERRCEWSPREAGRRILGVVVEGVFSTC